MQKKNVYLPCSTSTRISSHYTATCLLLSIASLASSPASATAPMRGNPVDTLPPMEAPAAEPTAPPALTPDESAAHNALQTRLRQQLTVRSFDVSGSKSIPFEQITAILEPLAGKPISVAELIQQVGRITALYQQAGFPLSFAILQEQDFAQGHVIVTVVEGHVGQIEIKGDPGATEGRMRRIAQPMLDEKPLTQKTLERTMNLLRTVPGLRLNPTLQMPSRTDGATTLVLDVTQQAVSVTASATEFGNGKQPLIQATLNSLTPLGETIRLTAAVPLSKDDARYFSGSLSLPLSANGLALDIDGYHYRSRPNDESLRQLGWDRQVTNERVGAMISYPLVLENQRSLKIAAGAYASRSLDDYFHESGRGWIVQTTDVRALQAELKYSDASERQSREISLSVSKGLDALGARKTLSTHLEPNGASPIDLNFTRWMASAKQNLVLPAGFGMSLSATGQYSNNVLPSSEQISFGAWRHGYGYPQGELAGDKGIGATIELNRNFNIDSQWVSSVQPYIAYDWAKAWYNQEQLQSGAWRLRSAAFGLRITNNKHYYLDINVGRPLDSLPGDDKRRLRFNSNFLLFYSGL